MSNDDLRDYNIGLVNVFKEHVFPAVNFIDPRIKCYFGRKHIAREKDPRRIVVVLGSESYTAPERLGRDRQSLLTRNVNLEVFMWAEDYGELEQMIDDWCSAVHDSAATSISLNNGAWNEGEEAQRGIAYALNMTIRRPVTKRASVKVTVTELPTTQSFDDEED